MTSHLAIVQQLARDRDKLDFFLTYADNNAVTFFAKQGFTTEVTNRRERVSFDSGTFYTILFDI